METKVIEFASVEGNWGKFLLGRMDTEWKVPSNVDVGRPVMVGRGWSKKHLWVMDLQTGEGAIFMPGGIPRADLNKHRIWVCPLFEPFLIWLYQQDLTNLEALPAVVAIEGIPLQLAGYRRPGPGASEDHAVIRLINPAEDELAADLDAAIGDLEQDHIKGLMEE